MGCSSCARNRSTRNNPINQPQLVTITPTDNQPLVMEKSADSRNKVALRYYGGGLALKTTGCRSCGSTGQYALTTTETISFASDDAPNGWFSETFHVGHDYYVTENQAKYLLSLTFRNKAGQIANKFKEV